VQRVDDGALCRGLPSYFKRQCPLTPTTPTDVEPVPQSCRTPGELKIIFCQLSMVATETVIHDAAQDEMFLGSSDEFCYTEKDCHPSDLIQ
jgi:hypothetical protein